MKTKAKPNGVENRISTLTTNTPETTHYTFEIPKDVNAVLTARIVGTAPIVFNRFSARKRDEVLSTQTGETQRKKKRGAKDVDALFLDSLHVIGPPIRTLSDLKKAEIGIQSIAIKSAMVRAAELNGERMVRARGLFFVENDGRTQEDGYQLIRLVDYTTPRMHQAAVRQQTSIDIRIRAIVDEWAAIVRIRFNPEWVQPQSVYTWLRDAGSSVGICEMRPIGRSSTGDMGTWKIESAEVEMPKKA